MKPLRPTDFPIDLTRAEAIIQALGEVFHDLDETRTLRGIGVHDTFDWRLYAEGTTLTLTLEKVQSGAVPRPLGPPELAWCNLDGGEHLTRLLAEDPEVPAFAWDIEDPALHRALEPILEMRRLLPQVHIGLEGRLVSLLDARGKTVVRLRIEQPTVTRTSPLAPPDSESGDGENGDGGPSPLDARLRVEPVRGYVEEEKAVCRLLADRFGLAPVSRSLFDEAMSAVGLHPGGYSSKVRVPLDPVRPAADAMREILGRIHGVMRANEEGTRRDLDSEFLHDFRVAIRRTRSALGQVKKVFPADLVAHFRRELAWIGRASGATRDLDVYLLKMPDYRASLPEAARRDLEPLRAFLEEKQEEEQKALTRVLDSDRYRSLDSAWGQFLAGEMPEISNDSGDTESGNHGADNANRPIGDLASARTWKAYRRVIRNGKKIDESSPDQDLHDLRIDCKKLRYLVELFAGLYDESEIKTSIRDLKRLQENLGDFNDYSVQRDKLAEFAEEMMADGSAPASTFLAMGQLMHRLEEGQQREREKFADRFELFTKKDCRARFRRLFAP